MFELPKRQGKKYKEHLTTTSCALNFVFLLQEQDPETTSGKNDGDRRAAYSVVIPKEGQVQINKYTEHWKPIARKDGPRGQQCDQVWRNFATWVNFQKF